jgi:hypothetical protein
VNALAHPIPEVPAVARNDRRRSLELAGRVVVACGWALGGIGGAALVLAAAVAAAIVALALALVQGLTPIRERFRAGPRIASSHNPELPSPLPEPDLG